jgi:hypothetical protein
VENMPIRYAARQIRRFNNYCAQPTRGGNFWRTVRNSALSYAGLKLGGMLASYVTGLKDIEFCADAAAPIVAGTYALSQTDTFSGGVGRDAIIVGIAAAMGADLGDTVYHYHGANDAIRAVRDAYSGIHATIANHVTNAHNPASTGAAIGAASGIVAIVTTEYNRTRPSRP